MKNKELLTLNNHLKSPQKYSNNLNLLQNKVQTNGNNNLKHLEQHYKQLELESQLLHRHSMMRELNANSVNENLLLKVLLDI